ncbi:MAG TPA: hypothetical protein VF940_10650 [Streptosporangiaceae bacterium]
MNAITVAVCPALAAPVDEAQAAAATLLTSSTKNQQRLMTDPFPRQLSMIDDRLVKEQLCDRSATRLAHADGVDQGGSGLPAASAR